MRARRSATACNTPSSDEASLRSVAHTDAPTRWRPIELLGRGGTAEVWRVADGAGREAVLKRARKEFLARPGLAAVLVAEYRWLETLKGEPFVAPLGFAEADGEALLALEYLPGGDLVSLLGARAVHWLSPLQTVARALVALHARGAAHADLKARHVLFAADGTARLIDLATVGPLDAPARPGTAAYRPAGRGVTGLQADAFALAALVFELCFARLPYGPEGQSFEGEEPAALRAGDRCIAKLAATARHELAAGGSRGLSPLLDVIESVRAG